MLQRREPDESPAAATRVDGECLGAFEQAGGRRQGRPRDRGLARFEQQLERVRGERRIVVAVPDRLEVVIGGDLRRLPLPAGAAAFDPLGDGPVQPAPLRAREGLVGDVSCERVLEDELPHPGHDRRRPLGDEAPPRERLDELFLDMDGRRPERPPHHRATAKRVPRGSVEEVDAGGDDTVYGVRDRHVKQAIGGDPGTVPLLDRSFLDQHPQDLLEVERVSVGPLEDLLASVLEDAVGVEQRGDQTARIREGQRGQVEGNRVLLARAPAGARLEKLRPRRAHDQHARVGEGIREVVEEVEKRLRGPVDVLDREHGRSIAAERGDVARPGSVQAYAHIARRRLAPSRAARARSSRRPPRSRSPPGLTA